MTGPPPVTPATGPLLKSAPVHGTPARRGIGGHQRGYRGESAEWLTPPGVVRALGPFALDPCCPPSMPWRTAARMIHEPADGLAAEWSGRVWLNPPYGPDAAHWLRKLAGYGNGIAILFARTETAIFFESVWPKASAVLFLRGRLHFHRPDGSRARANSGGPSVLVAYGRSNADALRVSDLSGAFVDLGGGPSGLVGGDS